MNKYVRPLRPTTTKNRYLNLTRREVRRSMPLRGRGVTIRQRASGVIIEARPGKGGSKPPVSDWFRGDWNPNSSYVRGEGVCVKGGITAGLYICHLDAPAGTAPPSPADSTNWTMCSSGNAMGLWM